MECHFSMEILLDLLVSEAVVAQPVVRLVGFQPADAVCKCVGMSATSSPAGCAAECDFCACIPSIVSMSRKAQVLLLLVINHQRLQITRCSTSLHSREHNKKGPSIKGLWHCINRLQSVIKFTVPSANLSVWIFLRRSMPSLPTVSVTVKPVAVFATL